MTREVKTKYLVIRIDYDKDIPSLGNQLAGRAATFDGSVYAEYEGELLIEGEKIKDFQPNADKPPRAFSREDALAHAESKV